MRTHTVGRWPHEGFWTVLSSSCAATECLFQRTNPSESQLGVFYKPPSQILFSITPRFSSYSRNQETGTGRRGHSNPSHFTLHAPGNFILLSSLTRRHIVRLGSSQNKTIQKSALVVEVVALSTSSSISRHLAFSALYREEVELIRERPRVVVIKCSCTWTTTTTQRPSKSPCTHTSSLLDRLPTMSLSTKSILYSEKGRIGKQKKKH